MDTKKHVHHKDMKNQYESSSDDSIGSCLSSCSSDQMEDVSSSPSSSSSYGPLFELSDLMAQLPIKRGLSKYYHGKSKTFTSLASVESLEDLAKRERPNKRMKSCKNYGGGLDNHVFSPKATISKKKSSRISLLSTPKANRSRTVFDSLGIS